MLYYSFIEFSMIYCLYFVSYNLFGGKFKKKKIDFVFTIQMVIWEINNSYKIFKNKPNIKHLIFLKFLLDSKSNQIQNIVTFSNI